MTYNVFGGTLNPAQSNTHHAGSFTDLVSLDNRQREDTRKSWLRQCSQKEIGELSSERSQTSPRYMRPETAEIPLYAAGRR